MIKRRRIQLGMLATATIIALPIAVVVSCGDSKEITLDFIDIERGQKEEAQKQIADNSKAMSAKFTDNYKNFIYKKTTKKPELVFKNDFNLTIVPPSSSGIRKATFIFKKTQNFNEQQQIFMKANVLIMSIKKWIGN